MHPSAKITGHQLAVRANIIATGKSVCTVEEIAEHSDLTVRQVVRAADALVKRGFGFSEAKMLAEYRGRKRQPKSL